MREFLTLTSLLATPVLAEPQVVSQVAGLVVGGPFDAVPAAPAEKGDQESCSHLFVETPTTEAGRATQVEGWNVTSEAPFGDLTAVGFVAASEAFTSGTCELLDGNIGLFFGTRMIALLYSTEKSRPVIGSAQAFGETGLRIFSGDMIPSPVADIRRIGTDGIAVTPPALEEPACNGVATLPYLYGLPIDLARALLIDRGWQPVPGSAESQSMGQAQNIAAHGVIEVEDCSGTGFAFCTYSYSGPAGRLSVTTAGEIGEEGQLPSVTGYGVDCATP